MESLLRPRLRRRAWYVLAVIGTIAAGLASRRWPQVLPAFLGKYPGDALWALMVFFGLGAGFSRTSTGRLAAGAAAFSCGIEMLKLYDEPWAVAVRHTTVGHLVFGHVFSWMNFVAYAVGIGLGVLIETWGGAGAARAASSRGAK